jgi:hypothetical protein
MDKIADDEERLGVLERLVALGEKQSVITADVNPLLPDTGVRAVVDLHGLLGAGDVGVMTEGR